MTICCFVADTKNSIGLAGCIEEVAHNAIAVYWNPLESAAKVTIPPIPYLVDDKSKQAETLTRDNAISSIIVIEVTDMQV